MSVGLTPFQPVGPYFHVMLRDERPGIARLVDDDTPGQRIVIEGTVFDGSRVPVTDGLVEIWQADADGRYVPAETSVANAAGRAFTGYGRVATDTEGGFRFETVKPGPVRGPDGETQAPHVLVSFFAPGVLTRYWTRAYFDDEPSNATDRVLQVVPAGRRDTLVARTVAGSRYRFDIVLQGVQETVFFDA